MLLSLGFSELGIKGSELIALDQPVQISDKLSKINKILILINEWIDSVERIEAQKLDFIEHSRMLLDRVLS